MIEQILVALTMTNGEARVLSFAVRVLNADGSVQFAQDPSDDNIWTVCRKTFAHTDNPVVSWRIIAPADLPASDEYQSAWVDTGAAITHHMGKAREIHRDKLRRERAPLLANLDVEYQRADETGDTKKKGKVAQLKQRLRDVTTDPRIEKAATIEELAAVQIDARVLDW